MVLVKEDDIVGLSYVLVVIALWNLALLVIEGSKIVARHLDEGS
jgi:hypothetical protein